MQLRDGMPCEASKLVVLEVGENGDPECPVELWNVTVRFHGAWVVVEGSDSADVYPSSRVLKVEGLTPSAEASKLTW